MRGPGFGFGGLLPLRRNGLRLVSQRPVVTEGCEARWVGGAQFSILRCAARHRMQVDSCLVHRRVQVALSGQRWPLVFASCVLALEVRWEAGATTWLLQMGALGRARVCIPKASRWYIMTM